MPLSAGKEAFKTTMKTYLESVRNNTDPDKEDTLDEYLDALADAVEAYIKTATVLPTALLAPPGTVGGPVTGTGTLE